MRGHAFGRGGHFGHFGRGERMHGGRGREHGGRGGGRIFDHGDLRWVVLAMLAEQPRHGYEIIKEIEDRVGGAYSPSPGVIYPTLTLLEETGMIAAQESEGGRKLYKVLPEGEEQLKAHQPSVDGLVERMARVRRFSSARTTRGETPPALRSRTRAMRSNKPSTLGWWALICSSPSGSTL